MYDTQALKPLYTRTSQNPTVQGTLFPCAFMGTTDAPSNSPRFPGTDKNASTQIQIANISSSWAWVNFGVFGNVAAAAAGISYPVAPGAVVVVSVDPEVTGASVVLQTAAATGNMAFTRGEGL